MRGWGQPEKKLETTYCRLFLESITAGLTSRQPEIVISLTYVLNIGANILSRDRFQLALIVPKEWRITGQLDTDGSRDTTHHKC